MREDIEGQTKHLLFPPVLLLAGFSLALVSCGGGGGSSRTVVSAPCIVAQKIDFPIGSAPAGFNTGALVLVLDNSCSSTIDDASVTLNGVRLAYNATNQDYEGDVVVAPGGAVSLSVVVGGIAYAASGTQFASYPAISAPAVAATWSSLLTNLVGWSGGAPTTNAVYGIGVLDAADPNGQLIWPASNAFDLESPGTSSVTIPTNSLTEGNRLVVVGLLAGLEIPGTAEGSGLVIGGFNYVPITVVNNKLPGLQSIAVTPASAAIGKGTTQQFVATGTISDNTTMDVTTQVTWTSSDPGTATINATGLVTAGTADGTATITATFGTIAGSTPIRIVPGLMPGATYLNPFNPVGQIFVVGNTAIGDLNGDGRNDVAAFMGNSAILIYYQNAQGTLDSPQLITTDLTLKGISIADVNNDGLADLIVSGDSTTATSGFLGRIAVFLQDGVAHAPGTPQEYTVSTNTTGSLAVADLNGDLLPDIVTAGAGSGINGVVSLFFQGTGGALGPEVTYNNVPVQFDGNGVPGELHVADMNNDGRNDIVLQSALGQFAVIKQASAGTFSNTPDFYTVPTSCSCFNSFALGDLNGDGLTDVAVADPGGQIDIFFQNAGGILAGPSLQPVSVSPQEVHIADLDGDGLNDFIVLPNLFPNPANKLQVLYQSNDHSFGYTGSYSLLGCTPDVVAPRELSIGDVTGDGLVDIVTTCTPSANPILVMPRAP